MVGPEAGLDEGEFAGLRFVERRLAGALFERVPIGELVGGVLTPAGGRGAADLRGHPHAALAVDHGVVGVGRIVGRIRPQPFVAPVERGADRLGEARGNGCARLAQGDVESRGAVLLLVENDELAVAGADGVIGTVGVHRGVLLVGGDLVVHEGVVVAHVPQREDDVALDSLRARRRGRHLAGSDAIRPIGENVERTFALPGQERVHGGTAGAGTEAPLPGIAGCFQTGLTRIDVIQRPGELVAELMAEVAIGLDGVNPVVLRLHEGRETVSAGSGTREHGRGRRLEQRQPVVAGVDLGGFLGGLGGIDVEHDVVRVGLHLGLGGIAEAVAADPHLIGGVGELRKGEAALIVGDDDLDEPGGELIGLGDDPDAGLGTFFALDRAGDVAGGGLPVGRGVSATAKQARGERGDDRDADDRGAFHLL